MNVKIVSSITRLANDLPLGSYVIYTALETYSFSLGATPAPITTIVQTPTGNYTCYYNPGTTFTYTNCSSDQSSALIISLAIGFFLAVFLSFLKQVPKHGAPPLAEDDGSVIPGTGTETRKEIEQVDRYGRRKPKKRVYRWGVIYAEGNIYYLDFGDFHVWGHAALSFAAFGALSLFSASVSQCLFPKVRPWIFVFAQITLLVISCFIAMFWIDDPTLSIGLMIVPEADTHYTQTPNNNNLAGGAVSSTNSDVGTSTTNLVRASPDVPPHLSLTSMHNTTTPTTTSANLQLSNNVLMNAALSSSPTSAFSGSTVLSGYGYNHAAGLSRMSLQTKQGPTMSSVVKKQGLDYDQENQQYFDREKQEVADEATAMVSSESSSASASEKEQYVSVKMN